MKPRILVEAETNPVVAGHIVESLGQRHGQRLVDIVLAAQMKPLNRYSLREGRIFGDPRNDRVRYRIIDVNMHRVIYKDLRDNKIGSGNIDDVLEDWALKGIVEITPINSIIQKLKSILTPWLGGALVGALIAWLLKRLGR